MIPMSPALDTDASRKTLAAALRSIGQAHLREQWFDAEGFLKDRGPSARLRSPGLAGLLLPSRFARDNEGSFCDALLKRVDNRMRNGELHLTFLGPYFDRVLSLQVDRLEGLWLPPIGELGDDVRRVVIDCLDDFGDGQLIGGRVDFKGGADLLFAGHDVVFHEVILVSPLSRQAGLDWDGSKESLLRLASAQADSELYKLSNSPTPGLG